MIGYCPYCRDYVSAYYRDAVERRIAQHIAKEHPNVNGGAATGRPHHTTTPTDERRQQQ